MPDAGGDIFLGNIARQNNIESIKIPGYKTPYVTADGKVIIEVSYLNEAYDGQEGEAEFQFVGLGAEELGLNGKKLSFHDNNKKSLGSQEQMRFS